MAAFVRVSCALAVFSVGNAAELAAPPSGSDIDTMWKRFMSDGRNSDSSNPRRFRAFKTNVLRAHWLNQDQGVNCTDFFNGSECIFGITEFSAMFADEFAMSKLGYQRKGEHSHALALSTETLPAAPNKIDWRAKGAVTPVKNQGNCGSCWAFSTCETVESAVFMSTGKLPILSTQQLISCDKTDGGCNGGDTVSAYAFLKRVGGLGTAADFPDKSHVTGRSGKCKRNIKKAVKITGFTYAVPPCNGGGCTHQNEGGLATALAAKGPISICVNADGWQVYKGGVYSRKCSGAYSDLDHCVQLVGYDKTGSTPFWIIRNSWTTTWGINGYIHLKMGENACGVADEATIPKVATADFVTV